MLTRAERNSYLLMLLPLLAVLGLMFAFPLGRTIYLSFTGTELARPGSEVWNGMQNYRELLEDPRFWNSLLVTFHTVVWPTLLQLSLGLMVVLALQKRSRLGDIAQTILFAPMVLPPLVVALAWKLMYFPRFGGLSFILSNVGIGNPPWLTHPTWALVALIITATWQWTPFVALFLLAAARGLPQEPYESASLDGASSWQIARFITIPMLMPAIAMVAVLRVIESLKIFPLIYILTNGGPGTATESSYFYTFTVSFEYGRVGYGSALAVVNMLLTLVATYFLARHQLREARS